MNEIKVNDIVMVLGDYRVEYGLGVVCEVREEQGKKCYDVFNCLWGNGFIFSQDQIRFATEDEIRECLRKFLLGMFFLI